MGDIEAFVAYSGQLQPTASMPAGKEQRSYFFSATAYLRGTKSPSWPRNQSVSGRDGPGCLVSLSPRTASSTLNSECSFGFDALSGATRGYRSR